MQTSQPDDHAQGLRGQLDPMRYDGADLHPLESNGMIGRLIREGSRVLDVGCGTGRLSEYAMKELGCTVIGVEPQRARAEEARRRGVTVLTEPFGFALASQVGPFDYVLFVDVLEHLVAPDQALLAARSCLASDGRALISVPNVAHFTVRIDLLLGRFDYQDLGLMDATHLRWFTQKTLLSLLSATGFAPEHVAVTRGLWIPQYARRPWCWLKGRKRGVIDRLCERWPLVFGLQHIVVAKVQQ